MSPLARARALEALDRRIQAIEARLLREPRWLSGPTGAYPIQQRLSERRPGILARHLARTEARILSELTRLRQRSSQERSP